MKKGKPDKFEVRPPHGPACHATPVREPCKSDPRWYWRVTVYQDGASRDVWTGRGTPDQVRAEVWQIIGRGEHLAPTVETQRAEITTLRDLAEWWRGYLDTRTDLSQRTRDAYASHSRVLEEVLGDTLLERLGTAELEHYRSIVVRPPPKTVLAAGKEVPSIRRKARASASLDLDFTIMSMMWDWGRMVGACPKRDLVVPNVNVRPLRDDYVPTPGEVAMVAERVPAWTGDLLRAQWATGCRLGELAALTVGDINVDRAELRVDGKTGPRMVPLPADALPLFKRMVKGRPAEEALFGRTEATVRHVVNTHIRTACDDLHIHPWTTHRLRAAYIMRALDAGVDVKVLSTITGHTVEVLLKYYRKVREADRRSAVAKISGRLPAGEVRAFRAAGDRNPHTGPAQSPDDLDGDE
jgi:integrase